MVSLFAVAAFTLAGCEPPATTNTNTNTNTNTAPRAAAPTADSLMALENKAWEAYKNKDGKYFESFLGDSMISGQGEGSMVRADVVKTISEGKHEVKSFSLSDPHVTLAGADAVVLTYKATVDGVEDGKPIPSPATVATVFVRSGTDWKAVYHNEVAIVEAAKSGEASKAAPAAPAASEKKESAPAADEKKEAAPASSSDKKVAPANTATNSNAASNTNSTASSTDAALTDALMVLEKKGWEGWKAKDAKALEEITGKDLVFVDTMGKATFNRADVMKMWTTDNPCTVSSVSLSDGKAVSITKDAAILVVKGTAVGTCGDTKLEPLWNTSVFVKEGDMWKVTYIFESPIGKM